MMFRRSDDLPGVAPAGTTIAAGFNAFVKTVGSLMIQVGSMRVSVAHVDNPKCSLGICIRVRDDASAVCAWVCARGNSRSK